MSAVCDELKSVSILHGFTIRQDGLVLLTRDECRHHRGLGSINLHTYYSGMAVNCFQEALHLPIAAAQEHIPVEIGQTTERWFQPGSLGNLTGLGHESMSIMCLTRVSVNVFVHGIERRSKVHEAHNGGLLEAPTLL